MFKNKVAVTILCLTLLYSTWGSIYLAIKFALESFPPVLLSSIRYITAGSIYLLWCSLYQRDFSLPAKKELLPLTIIAICMISISGAFLCISEVYVSSGITALILGSTPIWMVMSAFIINKKERPSKMVTAGLLIGFIGVVILAVSTSAMSVKSSLGVIAVFISMAGWVAGSLYAKLHRFKLSITKQLGFQMIIGGSIMFIVSWVIGEWDSFYISAVSAKSMFSLIHMVILGSLVGYTSYTWLLFNTPTHVATSYAYVEPVLAVILGTLFAGELFTAAAGVSCALIIISVITVMISKN